MAEKQALGRLIAHAAATLLLSFTMSGVATAYDPPIGIPAPPFGIDQVAGPATHTSVPNPIPAGSVVQLPSGNRGALTLTANGTAAQPVFVRGADCTFANPTTITGFVTMSGSYLILECVDIAGDVQVTISGDHQVLRYSKVRDYPEGRGSFVRMNGTYGVLYQSEIARNGQTTGTKDSHGVMAGGGSSHNWILENHIHQNGGDGIQFCHNCIGNGNGPAYVYIGRNEIWGDRENALDIKEALGPVIVSQNEMHGYANTATSNGEVVRINDEGTQGEIWLIYNKFYDAGGNCISPASSSAGENDRLWIIGNTMWDCNSGVASGASHIVNNTVFNTSGGISGSSAVEVRNNIVMSGGGISSGASTCSHNLVSGASIASGCSSTVSANPLLINAAAGNFHIPVGSPARDVGTLSGVYQSFQSKYGLSIAFDQDGQARPQGAGWDIGAFEYSTGGSGSTPPSAPTGVSVQ